MADIKITELPQATSVSDSDELIIQQPSGTKRAGIADLPVGSPLSAGDGIDITNNVVSNTKPMNYEETGSVPSATPLNADQLEGHPASYFATKNDLSLAQTNLADSETSPSTHSYSVGQYLVYNGQLYRVKTAISVGESLVVGTNIETTSIGDELTTIETITLTNGADHSQINNEYTVSLKRVGKLCILNLDIKFGTVSGNQCIGYVVPVGARPSFTARSMMTQWKANAYSAPLSITNEGLVSIIYPQSNTEYTGQAVWFC